MLPFLKPKKAQTGVIIEERSSKQEKPEENQEHNEDLEVCAMDLLKAIMDKDVKAMAQAMRSAFEILESQPHEEDNSDEKNDFNSMNIKAAQQENE